MATISVLVFCIYMSLTLIHGTPADFQCPMSQLAVEFALEINPTLTTRQVQDIVDALNGAPRSIQYNCNVTLPSVTNSNNNYVSYSNDDGIPTIYVSDIEGNDELNNGHSIKSPFKTIQKALNHAQIKYGPNIYKQILLRGGKYHIGSTIYLNHLDSNLLITSYNNEYVNISGAIPLNTNWKSYDANKNIYSTLITNDTIKDIKGLRINGYRGVRARFPNVNSSEVYPPGFGSNLQPIDWIMGPSDSTNEYVVNTPQYVRNNTNPAMNTNYHLWVNGSYLSIFTPYASFFHGSYPIGMQYNKTILPNSPYLNVTDGLIHVWRSGHWEVWMYEINNDESNSTAMHFVHGGGNQGSRPGGGDNFFIENVFEELDYPNEWIFNTTDKLLYFVPNTTTNVFMDYKYETTFLKVLMELNGNQTHPVKNVTISNMAFIDTVYTYMDDHGVPSGGDWAFQYSGAINVIGTEEVSITNNLFSRLDGNGIFLFTYNRNTTISYNEFVFIGDSAIGSWGNTVGYNFTYLNNSKTRYATMGQDGTGGDQPRFTNISYNFGHELGLFEKQASLYSQFKSCQTYIGHNIFFNGPRAGINFNDGFGGDSLVEKNLIFNVCRESSDHGPFNSWDRQPYITKVRDGVTPSITKAFDRVYNNFFVSNYGATYQIDNDDTSQYYHSWNNFLVYGIYAFKSNFGGHDIIHWNNIYAYTKNCMQLYSTVPYPSNKNMMQNCTCIVDGTATSNTNPFNYALVHPNCDGYYPTNTGGWLAENNTIMINNGTMDNTGYCGVSLTQIQKSGTDLQSTVTVWPNTKQVIQQARELLWT